MKIVKPNNNFHTICLIPRYNPTLVLSFYLLNEITQVENIVDVAYNLLDGYLQISFDFDFQENEKYQFKLLENENVVYRGKIFATDKDTQLFLKDTDQYYYE